MTEDNDAFIGRPRAVVAGLPAYRPGKGIKQAEAEHGITNAIKLASNENPAPPVDPIVAAIRAAAAGLNRYADHRASELRSAIAASVGVNDDQVTVGAGSSGLLQQLCMTYLEPGDEVVYPWRSFEVYPVFTALMGGVPVPVPLDADLGFDIDGLVNAITPRTKLLFLATPNNPIGSATTVPELRSLLERVPADVVVCIDEAYREFLDPGFGDPVTELLPQFPNAVVTRTFSKAHGLAGARVGYALGDARLIAAVDRTLLPFAVSALAQAGAMAALANPDVITVGVNAILAERARVEVELAAAGWTFPNHQGNFVWLGVGPATDELASAMERNGVIVRPFSGEGIRVTIGTPAENDRFLGALAAACADAEFEPT
ncbi:MAG TPA: histidinol-phosphate transaminase [Ilumatobacter sp.]|nr:histidinol-phosphate transaminase [Ilumatobacter sp.]